MMGQCFQKGDHIGNVLNVILIRSFCNVGCAMGDMHRDIDSGGMW